MFVTGQSVYAGLIFSMLSFLVAIPSAIKVFNWTSTLYKGSISYEAPMLYALGFIGLFTMGGLTGLFLASLATDVHLNGTYFIVAHFHYIMVGGAVMGYLGGIHFWWPKISGRKYPNGWAALAAAIIFIGFNLTFFPQFILGYLGMPRRYAFYPAEFQVLNVMSSAGATVLGVGYLIPLIYLIWSMRYGPIAEPNPWGATGLEWKTASPPPTENFARDSRGNRGSVRIRARRRPPVTDAEAHAQNAGLAHQFEDLEQQQEADALGIWVFLVTEIMFFGGLFASYAIYRWLYFAAFRRRQPYSGHSPRRRKYHCPARQQPHDGSLGAFRANRQSPRARRFPRRHDDSRRNLSGRQSVRVQPKIRGARRSQPRLGAGG